MRIGDNAFKKLQARWYAKIAKAGFEDAEELKRDGEWRLKHYASDSYSNASPVELEGKQRYYELLGQAVCDPNTRFQQPTDQRIMQLHAQGKMRTEIQAQLLLEGTYRATHTICFVIRRYEHLWRLHSWTRSQRGLKI